MKEKTEEVIEVREEKQVDDERKWCVYCHTNKVNGKKYFGITSQNPPERRWQNGKGYKKNLHFWKAILKYDWVDGFSHEIIMSEMTEKEACNMEIELIRQYNSTNPLYGYNMDLGGTGGKHSEEAKLHMSKNHADFSGEKHPLYGKGHTQESREKMSQIVKKRYEDESYRKKMSDCHKWDNLSAESREKYRLAAEKLSKKFSGRNNPCWGVGKSVVQLNDDCMILDVFITVREAERQTGIDRSSIIKCCKGRQKSAGKHPITGEPLLWKYVYDQERKDGAIIQGAITLGYITQQQVDEYLNNLK